MRWEYAIFFPKDFPPNATSFSKLSLIALCSWSKCFRSFLYSSPAGSVFHTSKADTSLSLKDSMSSSSNKNGTWKPEITFNSTFYLNQTEIFFLRVTIFFLNSSISDALKSGFLLKFYLYLKKIFIQNRTGYMFRHLFLIRKLGILKLGKSLDEPRDHLLFFLTTLVSIY